MNHDLLVIIPAYNEAGNIEKTVLNLQAQYPCCDYVVVNDGSEDKTAEICARNGFHMIDMPVNVGLAHAVKAGMIYAYESGYAFALQFDADGQHDARYIGSLYHAVRTGECDIAIGSRFASTAAPFTARMLGSRILSLLLFLVCGQWIKDPTSGMRLFNRRVMRAYAQYPNINPEPDTIGFLISCGIKVAEKQVEMHDREAGKSMFNVFSSLDYMARTAFSLGFVQWFRKKDIEI